MKIFKMCVVICPVASEEANFFIVQIPPYAAKNKSNAINEYW
nr:hypothetical protein [Ectobacillus panaciterrae]